MNFVPLIKNLHHLRTTFNRVNDNFVHVSICNDNMEFVSNMLSSKMALILIDECKAFIQRMGYNRWLISRREFGNYIIVYLEKSDGGYNGSIFIMRQKTADNIYDYLSAYAICTHDYHKPGHKFDLAEYATPGSGYHRKSFTELTNGGLDEHTIKLCSKNIVSNPILVGKLWCAAIRYYEGDDIWVEHTRIGLNGRGDFYRVQHKMLLTDYYKAVDSILS